ncbi:MAG TPA: hypothetical protein VLN48_01540 [Bryobacteraceae bacterium]|nr:hypothetical protein [Bryobacteraceae bacterium]
MRPWFVVLLLTIPPAQTASLPAYSVTVLAGSDWVGDGGPATQALLFQAEGLAADSAGNLYIADAQGHRVRQVSPAGVIRTIAGTGQPGFSGDGGPAGSAQLNAPYGLAFDNRGNLYIADLGNARVRKVNPDGRITTVAGAPLVSPRNLAADNAGNLYISDFDGHAVYRIGADGVLDPLVRSGLRYPTALALDRSGVLYIADSGDHVIRKYEGGLLTSIAAAGTPTGLAFDAAGALYIADFPAGQIMKIAAGGAFSALPLSARDIAFGPDGKLYAAAGPLVREILPAIRAIGGGGSTAFGDGGHAGDARLNHPTGVAADEIGNVYIADRDNHRIRRVAPDGIITTIAGTGVAGNTGDGGLATLARLNGPTSVSLDGAGNLYVADTGNRRVRKFTPGGIMLDAGDTAGPVDAAADPAGNVYIADRAAGRIYLAAVSGVLLPFLDGLQSPGGVALDSGGNLYVSDSAAGRVFRRSPSGSMTELGAGHWINPRGIAVSQDGELFVADAGLGQVLRGDASGSVTPLAVDASIGTPWDVAIGAGGTLYVADADGDRVWKLTPGVASLTNADAVNAASLLPGPIAPGMLVAIRGVGRATDVFFGGLPAAILATDDSRILVQAPAQIAAMDRIQIEVRDGGILRSSIPAAVAAAAPGLFTTSSGQAGAVNPDGVLNSAGHPVSRGSWISLYGTGEGIAGLPVSVRIGGYAAEVLYAGAVAGYPGLFQINVRVPAGYMAPGILSVVLTVGEAASQDGVTIAVD